MNDYIDGFVIPVSKDKIDAYRELAERCGKIWMEHGALEFRETVGEDLNADKCVAFPALAGAKEGETVVFSFIVYRSKEDRDAVNAKVMEDPRMKSIMEEPMMFDCARMAYGGFETIVKF